MIITKLLLLLLVIFDVIDAKEDDPVNVKLQDGLVKGITMTTLAGKEFWSFRGIPYAESPTGHRRFKPPVAKKPLSEGQEIDATKDGPVCAQVDLITEKFMGQEDCLIVNVYTPENINPDQNKLYPVMVWIHGGGFHSGYSSSWMYGPRKLMDEDIVYVSINYRLNMLGFLSTNDDSARGNYGMLDQVEALKWVRENIRNFGGDANQVTIFGESAGGLSVMLHMLSPLSENLFHRAISMSGNPLATWALVHDPLHWAKKLGKLFNCPTNSNEKLVNCLRNVDAKELIEASRPFLLEAAIPYPPTVDGKFLEDDPRKLLTQEKIHNKVPTITGMTKDEGAGLTAIIFRKLVEYSDEIIKKSVKVMFNNPPNVPRISNVIKEKYFQDENTRDKLSTTKAIAKFMSDGMDVSNILTVEYLTAANVKTFTYSFDFAGKTSITQLFGIKQRLGVAHADELIYFFDNQIVGKFGGDEEITKKLVSLWTNFAKYGDPNGKLNINWTPVSKEEIPVCHINKPISVELFDPKGDPKFNIWLKLIPEAMLSPDAKEEL